MAEMDELEREVEAKRARKAEHACRRAERARASEEVAGKYMPGQFVTCMRGRVTND